MVGPLRSPEGDRPVRSADMDRQRFGAAILHRAGWGWDGQPPDDPVVVIVVAPHTSNWDLPLMLLLCWATGIEPRFLLKREAFRGPAGPVLRRLGGVAVDRSSPHGLVEQLAAEAHGSERMQIIVAPEGTRKRTRYWKSGFYRLAQQADLPICLAYCDARNKRMGFGPVFRPSGDIHADMDRIREFYADKSGVKFDRGTPPRLREEDEPPAG